MAETHPYIVKKKIQKLIKNLFLGQQHSGHGKRKIPQHISEVQGQVQNEILSFFYLEKIQNWLMQNTPKTRPGSL